MNTLKNPTFYIACLTIVATSAQAETTTKHLKPEMAKSTSVTAVHPLLMRRAEVRAAASIKAKSWAPMNKVAATGVKAAAPSSDHWVPALRTHVPEMGAPALRTRIPLTSLKPVTHSSVNIATAKHSTHSPFPPRMTGPVLAKVVGLDYNELADMADYLDMWEAFEANGSQGFDPEQIDPLGVPGDGR